MSDSTSCTATFDRWERFKDARNTARLRSECNTLVRQGVRDPIREELPLSTRKVRIDVALVERLVAAQFPWWADLPIKPVAVGGWDNRTFHLGEAMSVRLPSAERYVLQVEKEASSAQFAPLLPPEVAPLM